MIKLGTFRFDEPHTTVEITSIRLKHKRFQDINITSFIGKDEYGCIREKFNHLCREIERFNRGVILLELSSTRLLYKGRCISAKITFSTKERRVLIELEIITAQERINQ